MLYTHKRAHTHNTHTHRRNKREKKRTILVYSAKNSYGVMGKVCFLMLDTALNELMSSQRRIVPKLLYGFRIAWNPSQNTHSNLISFHICHEY